MTSNTLTASCNSVRFRSIRWSTFPATYRKTPSKRSWTISLVLIIFSFRRIANRLWAEWGGWWLVWRTLPQGWKESPYVYQTLGSVATNALRELGLPCSQYIDDRHLGELWGSVAKRSSSLDAVNAALFVAATILTQLGYFLHLGKCVPVPTQRLIFLGHLVDTFSIPEDKKEKFIALRESFLSSKFVPLNELQRFQGKCISLTLMVPAAELYTRVVAHAISRCQKQGTPIPLDGDLREEILHWHFLDTWTGFVPWHTEEHRVLQTWWPILCHSSGARHLLAKAGDPTALIWPSRTHGFSKPKYMPLPWDLWAFRITRTNPN